MFERFTDRARRVVVLAQEEARMLDHDYIGTEHVLLGLIAEGEGVGGKALEELGVSLATVRDEILRIIGRGGGAPADGHIPFTPRTKKVLELALRESVHLGHQYIGTEHILLGLLREGEGVAAQILGRITGGLDVVRQQVSKLLVGFGTVAAAPPSEQVGVLRVESFSPGLRAALDVAAARTPSGSTTGSHHVLAVFAEWDDLAASRVLAAGGFDPSQLDTEIGAWPVADTRDETPDEWAQRVADITVEGDAITIRFTDDALRERIGTGDDDEVRQLLTRAIRELRHRPTSD